MRVVAGTSRGIRLSAPVGVATRPTSDRVKEALFSILASRIEFDGIAVLDICAGTGGLGIEALSRGAGYCCFIESNRSVKTILEKNLAVTGCADRAELVFSDAVNAIRLLSHRTLRFDLVLFDPPYNGGLYQPVLDLLDSSALLAPAAVIVAECSAKHALLESYGTLQRFARRVYGDTALELYTPEET